MPEPPPERDVVLPDGRLVEDEYALVEGMYCQFAVTAVPNEISLCSCGSPGS